MRTWIDLISESMLPEASSAQRQRAALAALVKLVKTLGLETTQDSFGVRDANEAGLAPDIDRLIKAGFLDKVGDYDWYALSTRAERLLSAASKRGR